MGLKKQGLSYIQNMLVFTFNNKILLWSSDIRMKNLDSMCLKKIYKCEFRSIVGPDRFDFSSKLSQN